MKKQTIAVKVEGFPPPINKHNREMFRKFHESHFLSAHPLPSSPSVQYSGADEDDVSLIVKMTISLIVGGLFGLYLYVAQIGSI
jgi:hypothetical protein